MRESIGTRALLMLVIHLIREQAGSPETNAGTSFQDLHVVLGGECPNGGMVFIAHAVHLDEVVGKVARNNGQEQSPVARADIAKGVWDITRPHYARSGRRRHLLVADRHHELSVEDVENL